MENKLRTVIDYLKTKKVRYADARYLDTNFETLEVKNDLVESTSQREDKGVGIRVLKNGAWGFASTPDPSEAALIETAERAIEVARASALANSKKVKLAPEKSYKDHWNSPCEKDPFEVPLSDKLALLFEATAELRKESAIKTAEASMDFMKRKRMFASTLGSFITQTKITSGASIVATATDDGEFQRRSYPNSHGGNYAALGYEFVEGMKLKENAEWVREEAVALLKAPECPAETLDLIIGSSQLALQVHESCGHPIELDRVMGTEISLAGGSFLDIPKRGGFQYGSEHVNIVADATVHGGLGSFGYDDEGVKAMPFKVVDKGVFKNYLMSRETAREFGMRSNGTMRADGWSVMPLIRMVNVNLEPGDVDLEDLIADTKDGILVDTNKSWSIDDLRLNFQFGMEIGWRIKDGKRVGIVKNPVYTGRTPDFWGRCDAVTSKKYWQMWGVPNCGKGDPMQTAKVGHGTSPARFRNVEVGVKK